MGGFRILIETDITDMEKYLNDSIEFNSIQLLHCLRQTCTSYSTYM